MGPSVDHSQRLIGSGTEGQVCERIVVFNKRDLVPEWGYEVCAASIPLSVLANSQKALSESMGYQVSGSTCLLRVVD